MVGLSASTSKPWLPALPEAAVDDEDAAAACDRAGAANEAGAGDPKRLPDPLKAFMGGGLYFSFVRR